MDRPPTIFAREMAVGFHYQNYLKVEILKTFGHSQINSG